MGRSRKGRPVSGWVIIDKPAGIGSTDVVNRVRRAFGAQKAGHAGTLDPDATGVLAVALGEATKAIPVLAEADKAYAFRAPSARRPAPTMPPAPCWKPAPPAPPTRRSLPPSPPSAA